MNRKYLMINIFLSYVLLAVISFADEASVKKYKDYTPEQVSKLSEDVISSSLPIMYNFAARKGMSLRADLVFGMELNMLMYPGIHDYKNAVKAFQKDLGDEPTGILTVWQIHNLEKRAEMQKLSTIFFNERFYSYIDSEYANIEGTAKLVDEKIAFPINHVRIKCFKVSMTCYHEQLEIQSPNEKSWSGNYYVNELGTEYYDITKWDENSIDATYRQDANVCRTTTLNLNFKTKEFYYITRNAGGDCKLAETISITKLDKPRIGQIVDGKKTIQEEFAKVQKAAFDVISTDFKRKTEKAIEEAEKLIKEEEIKNKK